MERGFCPGTSRRAWRSEFENSARNILAVAGGCAVEIARLIEDQSAAGLATVIAAGETVECGFRPGSAAGRRQLESCACVRLAPAESGQAVE